MKFKLMVVNTFCMLILFTSQAFGETVLPYYNSNLKSGSEERYQDSMINGYYKYVSPRWAYSFDVPKGFNYVVSIPTNGAGITIAWAKKGTVLRTSGQHLGVSSGREMYSNEIRQLGRKVTYSNYQADGYVISWLEPGDGIFSADMIFYKRVAFNEKYVNQFTLEYPLREKAYFDPIIKTMERSFIPGWKSGRTIYG